MSSSKGASGPVLEHLDQISSGVARVETSRRVEKLF